MRIFVLLFWLFCFPALAGDINDFRGFQRLRTPVNVAGIEIITPQGARLDMNAWRGKWVLLNTWASWCAPCVAELPTLQNLYDKNPHQNLDIIALSFDAQKTQEELRAFLRGRGVGDFAAYMDSNHAFEQALKAQGLPVTYVIDPAGKIVAQYRGAANWTDPKVLQSLSFFIKAGSTSNTSPTSP